MGSGKHNFLGGEPQELRPSRLSTQPAWQVLLKLQPVNLCHTGLASVCNKDKYLGSRANHHCAPT